MLNKNHFNKWLEKNYEITSNNKIKAIGKQRFATETDIYAYYVKTCEDGCLETDFTPQDIKNELATKYTQKTIAKPSTNTIKDWIAKSISSSNFKLTKAGRRIEFMNGIACVAADKKDLEDYLTMVNASANGRTRI